LYSRLGSGWGGLQISFTGRDVGTHIDAPLHLIERKTFISELPVERFYGHGCLLDVRDKRVIGFKKEYRDVVRKDDIVLLFMLFKNNILIIENMANLSNLSEKTDFEIFAFPLKIRAEASLVRVIARAEAS
jgi:kynurenine formamidase